MQPPPTANIARHTTPPQVLHPSELDHIIDHDFAHLRLSSPHNKSTGRKSTPGGKKDDKGKGVIQQDKWKGKGKGKKKVWEGGECHLLNLPTDVLHVLLTRLPPRSLLRLSATCTALNAHCNNDTVWRHSYINQYFGVGVSRDAGRRKEVEILARGCTGIGERGWKRESLERLRMLERWQISKSSIVVHTPPTGLIHSISLSYPPHTPAPSKGLTVGKTRNKLSPKLLPTDQPHHTRQKVDTVPPSVTRSPPYLLSASLFAGGVVRSDPITGKVSKGFWGPSRDSNFHLRPTIDPSHEPSSVYFPKRSGGFVIWGLKNGGVVWTNVQTRQSGQGGRGGRAVSLNVYSDPRVGHAGEVRDIWTGGQGEDGARFVSAGEDGLVKLWLLVVPPGTGKGKKNTFVEGSLECLFTSSPVPSLLPNRSEDVKRRQNGSPDAIVFARYTSHGDIVAGITADGDLRVFFAASIAPKEVRLDLGSAEAEGEVKMMEMVSHISHIPEGGESVASVVVHRHRSSVVTRYDISSSGTVASTTFVSPSQAPISCVYTGLQADGGISLPKSGSLTPMLARIVSPSPSPSPVPTPGAMAGTAPPAISDLDLSLGSGSGPGLKSSEADKGQFILAGDENGLLHLWSWSADAHAHPDPGEKERKALKSWMVHESKITALDVSCSIFAVGTADGYIKILDPLPSPSPLSFNDDSNTHILRSFHASHLSPAETLIATTDEPDARWYTVNKVGVEDDMVVAAVGRKVFGWRAGVLRGKKGEGEGRRRGEGKGGVRGGAKALHQDYEDYDQALDSPHPLTHSLSQNRPTKPHELLEREAMEDIGLDDPEDALQYALMLSMEGPGASAFASRGEEDLSSEYEAGGAEGASGWDTDGMDEETAEAIRQVEAFERAERAEGEKRRKEKEAEDVEMERILEAIERSERGI
ncbi:hypothetical protein L198_07001 [Cryptococcus wingfieldii CBS 7118]|uniref:F-box domain-containing protein n=1 Tax=Cryptococcus wingfieldii CBS 7118 TaxID=1295528 RepID=A0A1E3IFK4_9TREE|nr:hypothetical protein L198_07001 [Cryptococcus wingfieldii CBS 7118]ODN87377.1 hypothetical protein L198_07001 [Cryptococcus wingfieldii CBS 7118]